MILAFIAFIALGMPDGLLGVGWPSIRAGFSLPLDALGMLLITGTTGYLISSFFNGKLIARLGVGGLLAASCALTGLALLGYTLVPAWWMMVLLGVATGLGAGGIDAGLNTYVAANFGEGLMQWLHASYGIGITLGPVIMTTALTSFSSWRMGYVVVGAAQLVLGATFLLTLPMWKRGEKPAGAQDAKKLTDYKTSYLETIRRPAVWVSMAMFFLYTGAEIALGAWAYTLLTESRGVLPQAAGLVTGSYWAAFTIGRFLAGLYTRRVGGHTLVQASLLGALFGSALLWANAFPALSLIGVALIGFSIAPIFPALVSGTRQRVGSRYAANTIGMQIAGAGLSGAIIPGLIGALARRTTLEVIPVCLFALFAAILGLYLLSQRLKAPSEQVAPAEQAAPTEQAAPEEQRVS